MYDIYVFLFYMYVITSMYAIYRKINDEFTGEKIRTVSKTEQREMKKTFEIETITKYTKRFLVSHQHSNNKDCW